VAISRQEKHSFWGGKIDYSRVYSSNKKYQENDQGYKTISLQTNCEDKAKSVNFIEVLKNPVLVQQNQGFTIVKQSMSLNMLMNRINPSDRKNKGETYHTKLSELAELLILEACDGEVNMIESASEDFEFLNDVKFGLSVSLTKGAQQI